MDPPRPDQEADDAPDTAGRDGGGGPIQIVKIDEDDHTFFLDEDALNRILQDDRVKDKPICIVSVAGTDRALPLV